MNAAQLWSHLPAVIEKYDPATNKATVRCLIQMQYVDQSQIKFPSIPNVLIITPSTAFSGIKLPVRAGDKVVLHIMDRDIQVLMLSTTTAGLDETESVPCETVRMHDLTDCVAYTGFGSFDSVKPSDLDVWIFNNDDGDSYNHVRLKQNGDMELKTLNSTITQTKSGQVTIVAPVSVDITSPTTTMSGDLKVTGSVEVAGEIVAEGIIKSSTDVTAINVSLLTHAHTGNLGQPTSPPIPS